MTTTISTTMTSSLTATMSSTVTMPSTGTTTTTLTTTAVPTTAASLALSDVHFANNAVKWTSLGAILAFVIAYAFSFGPMTWLLLGEIFPDDIRGRAVAVASTFNWLGNLLVSLTFLTLMDAIGFAGTFFLFAGVGILAAIFIFFQVPETKGKTLEEVQEMMTSTAISPGSSCCRARQLAYKSLEDNA
eukprot:m.250281 g.250281  ORF g.250281 m.250281 type:complete len:188 (-) comp15433_c0_seq23:100-663(-)